MNLNNELARMQRQTVKQLKARYEELFGETTRTGNKAWLIKRLAWRMQMLEEGDLSERALKRAEAIANDADLRVIPPSETIPEPEARTTTTIVDVRSDDRLPPPGTILTRRYKGEDVQVQILAEGFEHQGKIYRSLSAAAKAITGSHCNGFAFFNLKRKDEHK